MAGVGTTAQIETDVADKPEFTVELTEPLHKIKRKKNQMITQNRS